MGGGDTAAEMGLGWAAGDRHRGAAAVPKRDGTPRSDSRPRGQPESGVRPRAMAREVDAVPTRGQGQSNTLRGPSPLCAQW